MAVTFGLIFGGWWLFQVRQAQQLASAPLPGDEGRQGRCVLWFIGSSSIHKWQTLGQDMAPWITHNRGIDGATFAELAPRFAHEPEKQAPQAIILYAGENDIALGGKASKAVADLAAFLDEKKRQFGNVPILVLSMKPSPARWSYFAEQTRYNEAAARMATERPDMIFVNTTSPLLVNGRPGNYYVADGVHLSPAGYKIWANVVRAALRETLPPSVTRACDPSAPLTDPAGPAGAAAAHSV